MDAVGARHEVSRWAGLALAIALSGGVAPGARAQLISPGKLAAPHAQLEGVAQCTGCHELGRAGAADAKCLACHDLLKTRIQRKEGFHATLVDKPCAECHKEHFGTEFAILRFDTAGFDHAQAGYPLRLAHRTTACRGCHKPALVVDAAVETYATQHHALARTYLGLGTHCVDCHRPDDVHAGQFAARGCDDCHAEDNWKKAPRFDHERTRYALTGRHREVACDGCHRAAAVPASKPVVRYAGVTFAACTDCHRDPHRGVMRQACDACHATDAWNRLVNRSRFETAFDHARTKFPLRGAHARAQCAKCHDPRAATVSSIRLAFLSDAKRTLYPVPRAADCLSCHLDAHGGTFARTVGGPACQGCHTESAWLPASYDIARHNRETYALTGAHVATPCGACHPAQAKTPPRFHLAATTCESCHGKDDPHAGQFTGRACSECHGTAAFRIAAFDHSKTRYPLDGAHRKVACERCHPRVSGPAGASYVRYRPLESSCRACHGAAVGRTS